MNATYLIALGSNVRHRHFGSPEKVLAHAISGFAPLGAVRAESAIIRSRPVGPSLRCYANAALILETDFAPPGLLVRLKRMERQFGMRRGQRWSPRVLDLDIILWSGGIWASPELTIPHPQFRNRAFVLPLATTIAPKWRDPITGLTLKNLNARLTKPRHIPS